MHKRGSQYMINWLYIIAGWICVIGGLIFLPLPTPFGLPLLIIGLALLISGSHRVRKFIQELRKNNKKMHQKISKVEPYLPGALRTPLEKTHPKLTEDHSV